MSNAHYVQHDEEEGDCTRLWRDVAQQRIAEYQQGFGGRLYSVADLFDACFNDAAGCSSDCCSPPCRK